MAKLAFASLQDEYLQIIRDLQGDLAGRAEADEHLRLSHSHPQDKPLAWATNPLVLSQQQYDGLADAASTMASIMEKLMAKYHRDRSFAELFGFAPYTRELTLVPSGCHAAVPLARLDLFFDPDQNDYQICGIVTGGVDGMAQSTGVGHALHLTNAFRTFAQRHPDLCTLDPLRAAILTVLHTYKSWANAEEGHNHPTHPSLAIVDVAGSDRAAETRRAIDCLRDMGLYARATDLSQLHIKKVGGHHQLFDWEGPITCVWLRATIEEAQAFGGAGLSALVDATRRGWVCTVGGYRSWPCCTRSFLELLHGKECRALLRREENAFVAAHVPHTHVIDTATDLSRFFDQDDWVLRTEDGHGASGVVSGRELSKQAWRQRLIQGIKRHDAVQEHMVQSTLQVAHVDNQGAPVEETMKVMLGLYVFEGTLAGIRVTCGMGDTIADWDPLEMGCVVVGE